MATLTTVHEMAIKLSILLSGPGKGMNVTEALRITADCEMQRMCKFGGEYDFRTPIRNVIPP